MKWVYIRLGLKTQVKCKVEIILLINRRSVCKNNLHFLVIGVLSVSSWAHSPTGITEKTVLGRVVGEVVAKQPQITRDDKDSRIFWAI